MAAIVASVEALRLGGHEAPVAHPLETDGRRGHPHAQQIPIEPDLCDDEIQQPFLLAKASRSAGHSQTLLGRGEMLGVAYGRAVFQMNSS